MSEGIESVVDEKEKEEEEEEQKEELKSKAKEEVKPKISPIAEKSVKKDESTGGLENLTDEDLKTLLRNFSDLTEDEQNHLISYLTKIEKTNPARVDKLRKYVNIGDEIIDDDDEDEDEVPIKVKKSPVIEKSQSMHLSDDEYEENDDLMSKINGNLNIINATMSPPTTSKATINDTSMLANDLMASLMQSSQMPQMSAPPQNWDPYYQSYVDPMMMQQQQHQQQQQQGYYGMDYHQQQQPPVNNSAHMNWPQNSSTTFMQDMPIHGMNQPPINKNYNNRNVGRNPHPDNNSRTRMPSNNLQLTGRKK
jgi:hypothetical protein